MALTEINTLAADLIVLCSSQQIKQGFFGIQHVRFLFSYMSIAKGFPRKNKKKILIYDGKSLDAL